MDTTRIRDVLADALAGRHLLTHPFYRRWEAGSLADGELAAYAEQYRLLERQLPLTLAAIAGGSPTGGRGMVQANLADELGEPEPHAALFESFARRPARPRTRPRPGPRPNCSPTCAPPRPAIRWPPWPWWRPTRSRRPTSRPPRVTGCVATTAWMAEPRGSGTSTPPRKWPTPTGQPTPWRRSGRTRTSCTPPRRRPTGGGPFSTSGRTWPRPRLKEWARPTGRPRGKGPGAVPVVGELPEAGRGGREQDHPARGQPPERRGHRPGEPGGVDHLDPVAGHAADGPTDAGPLSGNVTTKVGPGGAATTRPRGV